MHRGSNRGVGLMHGAVLLGVLAGVAACSETSDLFLSLKPRDGAGGAGMTSGAQGGEGGGSASTLCSNNKKDIDETDTDCGGVCSKKCPDGQGCLDAKDCQTGVCIGEECQAPTCSDKVTNGSETDVDCGGGCAPCGLGKQCMANTDCIDGVCGAGGTGGKGICGTSCSDHVQDQGETGVDCGGSCPKCNGDVCASNSECKSSACGGGLCRLPVGAACAEDAECATNRCANKVCAPCSANSGCASGQCTNGTCKVQSGAPCGSGASCANGACTSNLCVGVTNFSCGTDDDCLTYHCEFMNKKCAACEFDKDCDDKAGGAGQCDQLTGSCMLPAGAYCSPKLDQCLFGNSCAGFPPKCQ